MTDRGELGGVERFRRLSSDGRRRYLEAVRPMVGFARDHAVPIIFAPPLSVSGKVNGATGCIVRLDSGPVVITASHVLKGYEDRLRGGERLNWQLGDLPPFDPISRVAWQDATADVVVMRLTEQEIAQVGPCIVPTPTQWPPAAPAKGQNVLLAGYPQELREVDQNAGEIGAGPYSAMLPVIEAGEGYFQCHLNQEDLISYDGNPLPDADVVLGGLSGGPVLLVGNLHYYPLVGIITDQKNLFGELHLIRVATLAGVAMPVA